MGNHIQSLKPLVKSGGDEPEGGDGLLDSLGGQLNDLLATDPTVVDAYIVYFISLIPDDTIKG